MYFVIGLWKMNNDCGVTHWLCKNKIEENKENSTKNYTLQFNFSSECVFIIIFVSRIAGYNDTLTRNEQNIK